MCKDFGAGKKKDLGPGDGRCEGYGVLLGGSGGRVGGSRVRLGRHKGSIRISGLVHKGLDAIFRGRGLASVVCKG